MNYGIATGSDTPEGLSENETLPGESIATLEEKDTVSGRVHFRRRVHLSSGEKVLVVSSGEKVLVESKYDDPNWYRPIFNSVIKLLNLPENWDSYGASPVDARSIEFAIGILFETLRAEDKPPLVFPTTHGGIQLEWEGKDVDLEVRIDAPGKGSILFVDEQTGKEFEGELSSHMGDLRRFIDITLKRG